MAALNRFISRLGERGLPFFKLLKRQDKFHWTEEAERALQDLKQHLQSPPILTAPLPGETLLLYIAATTHVIVGEPPELFRLKCVNDHRTTAISLTHFKRNNPLVCRVSARYNHGSTGSKQVYLARRRVYNHRRAHQLLIYSHTYIITNRVQKQLNLYKQCSN
jgi:hypothetical protein